MESMDCAKDDNHASYSEHGNYRSSSQAGRRLLGAFHGEFEKGPTGPEVQFLRGEFSGWRSTLHTEYHDGAEEIVARVLTETRLSRLEPIFSTPGMLPTR
jgi:hypothetical protein